MKGTTLYVHSRQSAETGLHLNQWRQEVEFFKLDGATSYTLLVSRAIKKGLDETKCSGGDSNFGNYIDCVVGYMGRSFEEKSGCKNGGKQHTYNFSFKHSFFSTCSLLGAPDPAPPPRPPALPGEERHRLQLCPLRDRLRRGRLLHGLPPPLRGGEARRLGGGEQLLRHGQDRRVGAGEKDEFTKIRICFMFVNFQVSSTDVALEEEILVFDASDILTAVGGSLGLFLGFSCLEVVKFGIKMLEEKVLGM